MLSHQHFEFQPAFTKQSSDKTNFWYLFLSVVDCCTVPVAPHNIPSGLSATTEIRCIWCRWMPISDPRIAVQNVFTAILSILHLHNRKCLYEHTKLFGNIGFWNGTVSLKYIEHCVHDSCIYYTYELWALWTGHKIRYSIFHLCFSITPVVNIIQTFLNEDKLYNAVVDLPTSANFLGTITSIATHPMFNVLEGEYRFFSRTITHNINIRNSKKTKKII